MDDSFVKATDVQLEAGGGAIESAFDAVVSDGTRKVPMLLHPKYNTQVMQGDILPLKTVRITAAQIRIDETKISSDPFFIIHEMELLNQWYI